VRIVMRIDTDAHVDEAEATWEYLEGDDQCFKPVTVDNAVRGDQGWAVDGTVLRRPVRDYRRTGATAATSQLLDVDEQVDDIAGYTRSSVQRGGFEAPGGRRHG
jgi:hypothetical protein